jgi:hypothetical protein
MGWKMQKANQSPEKTRFSASNRPAGCVSAQMVRSPMNQNGESIEIGAHARTKIVQVMRIR